MTALCLALLSPKYMFTILHILSQILFTEYIFSLIMANSANLLTRQYASPIIFAK